MEELLEQLCEASERLREGARLALESAERLAAEGALTEAEARQQLARLQGALTTLGQG